MDILQQLYKQAVSSREKAYAPYSEYKVGAAIYAENEKIYASCNVENVSFPCGTCAEEGAIASMVANGCYKIKAILVVAGGQELVYPCGACLQRITEFSDQETKIYLADMSGIKKEYKISDLLPCNFKAKELVHD